VVKITGVKGRLLAVPYVTGSAKTGLITHDRKFNFVKNTQRHINTLSSFTAKMKKSGWSAAFSQPIGDPYEQSGPSGGKVED